MTTLRLRLGRVEAVARTKFVRAPERSRAEARTGVAKVWTVEAALVAYYLGGWRLGRDGFSCLLAGMEKAHAGGMERSLLWAAGKAEQAFSGKLGEWHTAERLSLAFEAIGSERHQLLEQLGNVLDRAEELGDRTLIKIAADYQMEAAGEP